MFNYNSDGGFSFSRSKHGFIYGDCENLRSKANESNLFGTWFRLVALMEILDYMNICKMDSLSISGYEMKI